MSQYCPVCYRPVRQTPAGNIQGHFDTNPNQKSPCPAAHHPYFITLNRIYSADFTNGTPVARKKTEEIPEKTPTKTTQMRGKTGRFARFAHKIW